MQVMMILLWRIPVYIPCKPANFQRRHASIHNSRRAENCKNGGSFQARLVGTYRNINFYINACPLAPKGAADNKGKSEGIDPSDVREMAQVWR